MQLIKTKISFIVFIRDTMKERKLKRIDFLLLLNSKHLFSHNFNKCKI